MFYKLKMEDITEDFVKEEESQKEENVNYAIGFALSGEEVEGVKNKNFEIIEKPTYEVFQDQKTNEVKRRMKLYVNFNGEEAPYFPNKTSQSKIVREKGRDLNKWIGYKGEFEVVVQKIGGENKKVIYIK